MSNNVDKDEAPENMVSNRVSSIHNGWHARIQKVLSEGVHFDNVFCS